MSTNVKRAAHREAAQVEALRPEGEIGTSFGLRSDASSPNLFNERLQIGESCYVHTKRPPRRRSSGPRCEEQCVSEF
jgi:hypothetical protein